MRWVVVGIWYLLGLYSALSIFKGRGNLLVNLIVVLLVVGFTFYIIKKEAKNA